MTGVQKAVRMQHGEHEALVSAEIEELRRRLQTEAENEAVRRELARAEAKQRFMLQVG